MNVLFFDTETTGLPDYRSPSEAPHQPHLVQIAAELCDGTGATIEAWQTIVKPDEGAQFHPQAISAHGITPERAMSEGISLAEVWGRFISLVERADGIVGHNISFDLRIMRIASAKLGMPKWQSPVPNRCTMRMATPILNLPPTEKMIAAGFNKPKSPKLADCIRFFFDEEMAGAHDAMNDVAACKRVYFAIKERIKP